MKAWLRRWLGIVDYTEVIASATREIRAEYRAALATLKEEHQAEMADLIQELNDLRNKIPVTVTQDVKRPIRVLRNFREFRTTIEHKPLRSERTH